jgi:hypothetical protein
VLPLVPTSSEYDRLLVEESLDELGGGPMDNTRDERLLVLDDASREAAAEGLAERIASRATSGRGIVVGASCFLLVLCVAAFRGVESHDASLVARFSEGMFQQGGGGNEGNNNKNHHSTKKKQDREVPLEQRLAPRAAAMPHDDDGAAQRAVDASAGGRSKQSALFAALDGAGGGFVGKNRKAKPLGRASSTKEFDDDETDADDGFGLVGNEFRDDGFGTVKRSSEVWEGDVWSARAAGGDWRRGGSSEDDDATDDAFFAIGAGGNSYGTSSENRKRDSTGFSRRRRVARTGDDGDDETTETLPIVQPTSFTHGATHQAALDELEASIKNGVVREHERRRRSAKRGK